MVPVSRKFCARCVVVHIIMFCHLHRRIFVFVRSGREGFVIWVDHCRIDRDPGIAWYRSILLEVDDTVDGDSAGDSEEEAREGENTTRVSLVNTNRTDVRELQNSTHK